ncbi:MAG: type II toxin-antitoxin system VapC family toxin [Pyrinomonadaceae bacterium]
MQPVLFDTSVYILGLRQGNDTILQTRHLTHGSPLWLSAVVLEELYAGANVRGRKRIAELERDFVKVRRILVPERTEWSRTGEILAQIGEKHGYEKIGKARMTNDVLIGTSAARQGILLLTVNNRDFKLIAEFCPLQYRLI